jgi:hypothetical protein
MSHDPKDIAGEQPVEAQAAGPFSAESGVTPLDATPKGRWERLWPVIACGAGLFSDGYLNGVSFSYQCAFSFSQQ